MPVAFTTSPRQTLGVELELQLLDPRSHALAAEAPALFERIGESNAIKPEIFRSMVEIATGVCAGLDEVKHDLETAFGVLRAVCRDRGLALSGGGSHPFARYRDRIPFPSERYQQLMQRKQWIARRLLIFGLHVHVGMRDGDQTIATMNALLPYSAHLLALSAASPFWDGVDTGLASARVTVFEALPTAGVPPRLESWAAFEQLHDRLLATGSIESIKDLWWDMRPQPGLGTLEIRVCDTPQTLTEVFPLVALVQALAAWADEQQRDGRRFPAPDPTWLRENKWRAARDGLDAEIVCDEGRRTAPLRAEIEQLLVTLEPIARRLGDPEGLGGVARALEAPGGHQRQREVFERTRSLPAVAEALAREMELNTPLAELAPAPGSPTAGR
jgi:carboxylate-amine ligase